MFLLKKKNLYMNVHSFFMCDSQKLNTAQMFSNVLKVLTDCGPTILWNTTQQHNEINH